MPPSLGLNVSPSAGSRRHVLVIHNPVAGPGRVGRLQATIETLAKRYGVGVSVISTQGRGHAESIARMLPPDACDVVAVAGGDGTINEVINGLAGRSQENADIALGIVPVGTTNVLAQELGLPHDPDGIAKALALGCAYPVHLGMVNGRCFAMMASAGLDARVVEGVSSDLKRLIGKGAYVLETCARLMEGRRRYCVTIGSDSWEVASVIVANGHYYGGRFVCAPNARLTDPQLHVCLFSRTGRWSALRYIWGLATGRLHRFSDYRVVPAERVTVTGGIGEPVQGDGDVLARLPVEIAVSSWRLPIILLPAERS